jgi:L-asparaginase / beta-aspartyl-peptidase
MSFQLMIHGGSGTVLNKEEYFESIDFVLRAGKKELKNGCTALDAVDLCVSLLEDTPIYNAGRGSVLSAKRTIEMDAAIMCGIELNVGSVAGIELVKNPIKLAKLVMTHSEHVMLLGAGAVEFGKENSIEMAPADYFLTELREKQLEKALKSNQAFLDHTSPEEIEKKFGTVGAVARDVKGNLAAGTSTGGITNKKYGRVGDTPIIGSGVFADNETCAVSATGYGEQFIRTTLAKTVSEYVRYKNYTAQQAADQAIKYLVAKVSGIGGIVVIDKDGNCGASFSSEEMIYGKADQNHVIVLT